MRLLSNLDHCIIDPNNQNAPVDAGDFSGYFQKDIKYEEPTR